MPGRPRPATGPGVLAGLRPMLATTARLPREDGRWAYEVKWDGVRALAHVADGGVRLLSRQGNDVSGAYPELQGLGPALAGRAAVLDGEVVAFSEAGRPDFGLLQSRMHVRGTSAARRLAAATPVTYLVFDLLHLDGEPLLDLPYDERRARLDALGLVGASWQVPPAFLSDGQAVLDGARAQGFEGVVAKRRDSPYTPGRRSDCWVKVKVVHRQEVVVGGWKPGEGGRAGRVGSLLLGVQELGTGLVYAGHVGTGFTAAALADLGERLAPLRRATPAYATEVPREHARSAVWVEPALVGEVEFTEWTRDGRLRHPSWKGLRSDKAPEEVVREPVPGRSDGA